MTQPDANTTEPDGWDSAYWPTHEVSAPSSIDCCPLCGALVGEWISERHVAYHRSRGEKPSPD